MTALASFPLCSSPSGTLLASYDSGTHGIVGSSSVYTGSDRVYQVSEGQITQCFCSSDGQGIQTNWWKSSSLTQEQVQTLIDQGWYYIPNGDLWGLTVDPYLAKNISYSCLSTTTTTTTTTSSSGSSSSDSGGGEVLGLAATGNIASLLLVFASSLALIGLGLARLIGGRHASSR